jgi:hypothetical protein
LTGSALLQSSSIPLSAISPRPGLIAALPSLQSALEKKPLASAGATPCSPAPLHAPRTTLPATRTRCASSGVDRRLAGEYDRGGNPLGDYGPSADVQRLSSELAAPSGIVLRDQTKNRLVEQL